MKIGLLGAEIQKSGWTHCKVKDKEKTDFCISTPSRPIFKIQNLNGLEFDSKHFYDANLVVKSNLLSKKQPKTPNLYREKSKKLSGQIFPERGKTRL